MKSKIKRTSFSKIKHVLDAPDLLDVQLSSYEDFLQTRMRPEKRLDFGLENVFRTIFPIEDNHNTFVLEYKSYSIGKPRYMEQECVERGITYSVPLKAKLVLKTAAEDDPENKALGKTTEQDVFFGNIPHMTPRGTFIINGAERIIVSQLQRSPGVFFNEARHPNGTVLYNARIIPMRGSWVDLTTDIFDAIYVTIDRRKKFPVTIFLRAIGFGSDNQILQQFNILETLPLSGELEGRLVVTPQVDNKSGELVLNAGTSEDKWVVLDSKTIGELRKSKLKSVEVVDSHREIDFKLIANSIRRERDKLSIAEEEDREPTTEDALIYLYRNLRNGEPPNVDIAQKFFEKLFFSPKKYDLGQVGRYRMNKKFNLNIPLENTVLAPEDFVMIVKQLISMRRGEKASDDIDHLGNRRVKTVGEQLANQFSLAFTRMSRTIKDRMNIHNENLTPQELINSRILTSVINTFFGTSQMSQFMDQTNPLAELTHKRRLSALGPGGLTRERAGFEVRDVHYTHYGRLCPIETPEGPNIGLISSLANYAVVNRLGFIETPYRTVKHGKDAIRVTNTVEYLSSDDEDRNMIAQANEPLNDKGEFSNELIRCRYQADYPMVTSERVNYMDVSPIQMVSAAACLIPFLEHDDANRALMGSNMQRQSVPLLTPETPLVGTGMEAAVARDSRAVLVSPIDAIVEYVDARKIVLRPLDDFDADVSLDENEGRLVFEMKKFQRTNQDTSMNQRPIVRKGAKVKAGETIADGTSTDQGELAMGRNVLVAFMPWRGYNYEDAIILNERLVKEDIFTSVHVKEVELEVRDTKRGSEELTREIPNVSEEATRNIDANGMIRIGAPVEPGDIIIGKVTPKGETDPTPEEKLLRAIFGEKAGDVKDASKRADPSTSGVVIDTRLFERKGKESRRDEKEKIQKLDEEQSRRISLLRNRFIGKLKTLIEGHACEGIYDKGGNLLHNKRKTWNWEFFQTCDFDHIDMGKPWVASEEVFARVQRLVENLQTIANGIIEDIQNEQFKVRAGDDMQPGVLKLAKVYIASKRKIAVGDKVAGRHGNKGVVSIIVPEEDMPFLPDGTPVDIILNPLGVPSRMNLGQLYETMLGWAAKKLGAYFETPVFDGASYEEISELMRKTDLPENGKVELYDGMSGDKIDNPVACGYIYMMKLVHMIEDKMHARSTGPYSLITQQPLGGKAQFGGQRFGEMEVWALEAYGAAHTLQEVLTVKSDDVEGRTRIYNAIVKGENLPEYGTPESFNVLLKELEGLGIEMDLV
ncbi:MAG: DNA-directed RNA polymerase subunit beta [Candidatus Neomarinimicrobiota bacterium]|jgi:DNA-directed RNA polymerase subunit beta|nr:DNA-directed RNA polymerase subunit beta [Candidatus Neomarinimicrobiota bacterium]MDX9780245.1 DNA-directed RNA polymerase subunit beta [bacterium]